MIQYRKTKDDKWCVMGPLTEMHCGLVIVTVLKTNTTKQENVVRLSRPFDVDGVPHCYGYLEEQAAPINDGKAIRRSSGESRPNRGGKARGKPRKKAAPQGQTTTANKACPHCGKEMRESQFKKGQLYCPDKTCREQHRTRGKCVECSSWGPIGERCQECHEGIHV